MNDFEQTKKIVYEQIARVRELEEENIELKFQSEMQATLISDLERQLNQEKGKVDWCQQGLIQTGKNTSRLHTANKMNDKGVAVEVVSTSNGERHLIQKSSINNWSNGLVKLYKMSEILDYCESECEGWRFGFKGENFGIMLNGPYVHWDTLRRIFSIKDDALSH
jgi:hypothetical protein